MTSIYRDSTQAPEGEKERHGISTLQTIPEHSGQVHAPISGASQHVRHSSARTFLHAVFKDQPRI